MAVSTYCLKFTALLQWISDQLITIFTVCSTQLTIAAVATSERLPAKGRVESPSGNLPLWGTRLGAR